MSKGKLSFTQGDLTRALKAAVKAGLSVAGYEIDRDGKIVVRVGKPGSEISIPPKGDKEIVL